RLPLPRARRGGGGDPRRHARSRPRDHRARGGVARLGSAMVRADAARVGGDRGAEAGHGSPRARARRGREPHRLHGRAGGGDRVPGTSGRRLGGHGAVRRRTRGRAQRTRRGRGDPGRPHPGVPLPGRPACPPRRGGADGGPRAPAGARVAGLPGRVVSGRPSLGGRTKVLYGVGAFAFGVKDNGFSFFLLLYYNQVLGLPEAWVGLGIMVALVIDALVDPVIGHVSDHLHSGWGRRHPFMYASAVPVAVAYFLLWNPPAGLSAPSLFAYFVVVAVIVRASIAVYEIPGASLVPELTGHYDERTSILSYRYFFGWWGGLGMMVLAYALFLQPDATHAVGVLNPTGYRRYGLVAAVVMLTAILVSALATHRFIPSLKAPPSRRAKGLRGIFHELVETLSNPSFVALFLAGISGAMAAGLTAALTVYLYTYFWELTSNEITLLVLGYFVSAMLAFAATPVVSRRLGKKPAAIAVSLAALAIGPT